MVTLKSVALAALVLAATPALALDITGIPRIVDGDTVEIDGTKIRLEGIDAPETDQLCLDAKGGRSACGVAAREALRSHTNSKPWTCRVSGQDKYGRSLATCSVAGEDVDRWMVRSGWALAFDRYSHVYDADQAAAQAAKAGIWAGAFIAPWDWRARNKQTVILGAASVPANAQAILLGSASAGGAPDPSCTIKGDITRTGECIYHVEGGRFYAKIKMDPSKGRRWFCSAHEAEAAGCRASKL
jgi:endonuclease YncB( thermonuclease family)